eukprot:5690652-Amphidinium_carterae.1
MLSVATVGCADECLKTCKPMLPCQIDRPSFWQLDAFQFLLPHGFGVAYVWCPGVVFKWRCIGTQQAYEVLQKTTHHPKTPVAISSTEPTMTIT